MPDDLLRKALDALRADDFQPGSSWQEAHQIAQSMEGNDLFDWLHALAHRIEGDTGKAGYWYRRAGRTTPS